jgi:hypothetical protein
LRANRGWRGGCPSGHRCFPTARNTIEYDRASCDYERHSLSAGESLARATVKVAARLLPRDMRDRYREQWLADLRDASEHDIPISQIAIGSLSFAAIVNRPPFPGLRTPTQDGVLRRSRPAVALALSTALLALSQYANFASVF